MVVMFSATTTTVGGHVIDFVMYMYDHVFCYYVGDIPLMSSCVLLMFFATIYDMKYV